MKINKLWNKLSTWKKILAIIIISIVLLISWFIYAVITDEPPHFFPLNDIQANYKITKDCPNNQGWNKSITYQGGDAYCLEYTGNNVVWKEEYNNANFYRITIGNSKIDLESYIGKQVKNIKGKYRSSSKQCILNKCTDISGPYVVLDIDNLEIVK